MTQSRRSSRRVLKNTYSERTGHSTCLSNSPIVFHVVSLRSLCSSSLSAQQLQVQRATAEERFVKGVFHVLQLNATSSILLQMELRHTVPDLAESQRLTCTSILVKTLAPGTSMRSIPAKAMSRRNHAQSTFPPV